MRLFRLLRRLFFFIVCDLITNHTFTIDIAMIIFIDVIADTLSIMFSIATHRVLIVNAIASNTFAVYLGFSTFRICSHYIIAIGCIIVNERCGAATEDKKYESE